MASSRPAGRPGSSPSRPLPPPRWWVIAAVSAGFVAGPVLLLGWRSAGALLAASLLVDQLLSRSLRRGPAAPDEWQEVAAALAERLGLGDPVVLLPRPGKEGQVLNALARGSRRRPVVVIAPSLLELSPAEREGLLAHELAHVAAADQWRQVVFAPGVLAAVASGHRAAGMLPGVEAGSIPAVELVLSILAGGAAVSLLLFVQRQVEWRADLRAVALTARPEVLAGMVERVSPGPHPARWVTWFFGSHPHVPDRCRALRQLPNLSDR